MRKVLAGALRLYAPTRALSEDAHDLTQEFFLRLLQRRWLARADRNKGRFRSFMLTVLKRFLADEWDKEKALKRGGNIHMESLSEKAESYYSAHAAVTATPEIEFERDWAFSLLANVLACLEQEYSAGGRLTLFLILKNYLVGGADAASYSVAAAELQMTEVAFKVAVCRIRQRFRDHMRAEVAATVATPADVEEELKHLCRILARTC